MADLVKLSAKGKELDNSKLVGGMKNAFKTPEEEVEANERVESKPIYGLDKSVQGAASKAAKGMRRAFGGSEPEEDTDEAGGKDGKDSSITSKVLRYLSMK
jgi:hypothetical protein